MADNKTIQVLEILKKISDEDHPVTQAEILAAMKDTGDATTENAATLSKTIDEILRQINPISYTDENDAEYRLKYDGYENDLLDIKETRRELLKARRRKNADLSAIDEELSAMPSKSPSITNLRYIHDFSSKELDILIQAVSFSDSISPDEKLNLIRKIVKQGSIHYRTPFYNRTSEKLKFNPNGVFSRTYQIPGKNKPYLVPLGDNISKIQNAINDCVCIKFRFNEYDADKNLIPRTCSYRLSPYYIVVYHDMYYLIGNKPDTDTLSHYRIDLMSDIEALTDENGNPIKRAPMIDFEELNAISDSWDPVKYMSEHLNMGYDKPRRIRIKIPQNAYTILHDWFGDYYEKSVIPCEEPGFDYVFVTTSPFMMVHWAMQYAGTVEVMDEEIRKKIKEEIENLKKKYE